MSQCVCVRCSQWGRNQMWRPAVTALHASRCLRDEGVRSIYQLTCVFFCRVRSLGLVSGQSVWEREIRSVYDSSHAALCENPAALDRVTPSGGGLNIYTSLHCEDSVCPGENTRKTVTSNAFHITAGSVCEREEESMRMRQGFGQRWCSAHRKCDLHVRVCLFMSVWG